MVSGFVSTGGKETTENFVAKMELKEGEKVLDVGCGIGGGDFYMAKVRQPPSGSPTPNEGRKIQPGRGTVISGS